MCSEPCRGWCGAVVVKGNASPDLAAWGKSWQPACGEVAPSLGLPRPQPGTAPQRLLVGLSARLCPKRLPPLTSCPPPAMADELSDLLREFDEVMEDFDRGPACQYEQHLEELKRKAGHSVYDSGIDELESESGAGEGGVRWDGVALGALGFLHGKPRSFLLIPPLSSRLTHLSWAG